jgi:adenylyl cyclase-associated protein
LSNSGDSFVCCVAQGLLAPVAAVVKAAGALKDRSSPFQNHMNAIAEGVNAFQWVAIEPMPVPIVEACVEASDFYANKVRVQYRGKDDNQVGFCNHFKAFLIAVQAYVKEHHTTGLTWNPRGTDVATYQASASAAAGGPSDAHVPPPATPAPATPPTASAPAPAPAPAPEKPAVGLTDLFAQLSQIDQSAGRTAGLRHVTKDMKSSGRGGPVSSTVPIAGPSGGAVSGVAAAKPVAAKKPPRLELVKKRWYIENHVTKDPLTVDSAAADQEVYISGCEGATIVITNKVKTMTIDSCKKTNVIFEAAISACEVRKGGSGLCVSVLAPAIVPASLVLPDGQLSAFASASEGDRPCDCN